MKICFIILLFVHMYIHLMNCENTIWEIILREIDYRKERAKGQPMGPESSSNYRVYLTMPSPEV